jgi:alkylation response protein AidB-like acyl-CoA dehydrogenase
LNFLPDHEDNFYRDAMRALADEYGWAEMQQLRQEAESLKVERFSFAFQKRLGEEGLIGLTWPKPYGKEARVDQQLLMVEELECQGFPGYGLTSIQRGGGMLLRSGTEAQLAERMPSIVAGEAIYCQGLSEPNAGSDLLAYELPTRRATITLSMGPRSGRAPPTRRTGYLCWSAPIRIRSGTVVSPSLWLIRNIPASPSLRSG